MKLFYEKQESEQKITYVEKAYSFYFVVLIAIISNVFDSQIMTMTGLNSSYVFGGGMLLLVVCRLVFMSSMRKDIAIARKAGKATMTGSRYSLTKPLITEITK